MTEETFCRPYLLVKLSVGENEKKLLRVSVNKPRKRVMLGLPVLRWLVFVTFYYTTVQDYVNVRGTLFILNIVL